MKDYLAEIAAMTAEHRRKLADQQVRFEAAPEVEIVGIVDARGAGLSKIGQIKEWTWSFDLHTWRLAGGVLQPRPLRLERQVTEEEEKEYENLVKPDEIVRIRAKLTEGPAPGQQLGHVLQITEKGVSDPELSALAAELRKPLSMKDQLLGTLKWDRALGWLEAKSKWNRAKVSVRLDGVDFESAKCVRPLAHTFWDEREDWLRRAREKAAACLLELKNGSWREDDEAEVDAGQFQERMKPESITFRQDGSFEFFFDDGGLFWGHTIIVRGQLGQGLTEAEIAG